MKIIALITVGATMGIGLAMITRIIIEQFKNK